MLGERPLVTGKYNRRDREVSSKSVQSRRSANPKLDILEDQTGKHQSSDGDGKSKDGWKEETPEFSGWGFHLRISEPMDFLKLVHDGDPSLSQHHY